VRDLVPLADEGFPNEEIRSHTCLPNSLISEKREHAAKHTQLDKMEDPAGAGNSS